MSNKQQVSDRVPPITSTEELARFFDENSTEDFDWEQVDTVAHRPDGKLVHLKVSLPRYEEAEFRRNAQRAGLTESAYILVILRKEMRDQASRDGENGVQS